MGKWAGNWTGTGGMSLSYRMKVIGQARRALFRVPGTNRGYHGWGATGSWRDRLKTWWFNYGPWGEPIC